jgi:hypothetical protein
MYRDLIKIFLFTAIFFLFHQETTVAQEWKFVKEKDGIRIYTKEEPGSKLKAFKGDAVIKTTLEEIYPLLSDPNRSEWWDDDVSHIDIIDYKKDSHSKYYIVYDIQWPFGDRDLYMESTIEPDFPNRRAVINTQAVNGVIPEKEDLVRITKYSQKWTAEEINEGEVHLYLEGFTDPGGNIPAWLVNSMITGTPYKMFKNLKDILE